ncbi:General secretion pathway protein C [Enhygromyxa salina]|uniref:General secretion pathway protein C n=1 Tax=Enhygromyxa salina TaxID=215803 RepID=A0A0C2DAJ4_9BACT|nr:type II secretion system protein GspC [Enhygromyxa salina]KIG18535.1 General secretion pathway protein C [Enhygromyxa salina]
MENLLKKYFWLIKLVGVGVAVIFAASAGVNMVVSKLALEPAGETIAEQAGETEGETEGEDEDEDELRARQARMMDSLAGVSDTTASRKAAAANMVVTGNIFCPTCAPEPEPDEDDESSSLSGPLRPGEIRSRLPLMLLATMESDDPAYSMATILHTDSNTLAPYSPNDTVRAGVVVTSVERGRVVFRNGAQMEYIELGAAPPPQVTATTTAAALPKPPDPNSREIDGAVEAISCDKDFTSCTVDKAFVEKLLANPAQLTKQARIVPAVRDGETKGYKFYGIRPGSLPKLLGMKNGDLLTSVNGQQLESLDQAMDLYTKLRRASHLSVTIERKGQQVQKEIDIK